MSKFRFNDLCWGREYILLKYKIAESIIDIRTHSNYIIDRMKPFLDTSQSKPGMKAETCNKRFISRPFGKTILNEEFTWVRKMFPAKRYNIYTKNRIDDGILSLMDSDLEWTQSKVYYLDGMKDNKGFDPAEYMSFHFIGVMFRNNIIFNSGIVVHASAIDYMGKGIIFSAPSGTGKSTHVRLWEEYTGGSATVLNDDTPAVKTINGIPYVFGTPWSGSSDKFVNAGSPLTAVVMLEQGDENTIRPLSLQEAVFQLVPRCFLPYYDAALMDMALNNLDNILKEVPVYLLRCKPDYQSVETVLKCILK